MTSSALVEMVMVVLGRRNNDAVSAGNLVVQRGGAGISSAEVLVEQGDDCRLRISKLKLLGKCFDEVRKTFGWKSRI